jgi:hypothetical protein
MNVKLRLASNVCGEEGHRRLRRNAAMALLALAGVLALPQTGDAQSESSHNHHAGQHHNGVQTGGIAIFSAGPVVSGPNYLLGYGPLMMSQTAYPPLVLGSGVMGFTGQGALLPSGGFGVAGNFPGVDYPAGNFASGNGPRAGDGGFGAAPGPGPAHLRARSNGASRARANQFMNFGDEHFRKQKYNDALERYKDASKSAPDLAAPYFRQAFAWAAMTKYDQAAKALHRGLSIDANWPAADFHLKQLYGDNRLAKATHWEAIAKAATDNPQDSDLLFLLAVELYCDGQHDRSRAFFQRAKTLEPGDLSHIKAFLSQLNAAAAQPQPAERL